AELADELARLSRGGPEARPLDLVEPDDSAPSLAPHVAGKRLAYGAAALVGLAVSGLLAATLLIPGDDADAGGDEQTPASEDEDAESGDDAASGEPTQLELEADAIQVVDPGGGDTSAPAELGAVVDGDVSSVWTTNEYNQENWGGFKEGFGLLLDLGEEREVVTVNLRQAEASSTVGLYLGETGLSDAAAGDEGFNPEDLDVVAEPQAETPLDVTINPLTDAPKARYLLVWCEVPAALENGRFAWRVSEIEIFTR
ncbi:MAG: hypothetical protein ACRDXX_04960, partial [Stackebrandtia sp.]